MIKIRVFILNILNIYSFTDCQAWPQSTDPSWGQGEEGQTRFFLEGYNGPISYDAIRKTLFFGLNLTKLSLDLVKLS